MDSHNCYANPYQLLVFSFNFDSTFLVYIKSLNLVYGYRFAYWLLAALKVLCKTENSVSILTLQLCTKTQYVIINHTLN